MVQTIYIPTSRRQFIWLYQFLFRSTFTTHYDVTSWHIDKTPHHHACDMYHSTWCSMVFKNSLHLLVTDIETVTQGAVMLYQNICSKLPVVMNVWSNVVCKYSASIPDSPNCGLQTNEHCSQCLPISTVQIILWFMTPQYSQELMSTAKRCEGASNCHTFVVPSSVEFSASKTRLIR